MKLWMWLRIFFVVVCAGVALTGNGASSSRKASATVVPDEILPVHSTVVPTLNLGSVGSVRPVMTEEAGADDVELLPEDFSFEDYAEKMDTQVGGIFEPRKPRASTVMEADLQVLGSTLGTVLRPGGSAKADGTPRAAGAVVANSSKHGRRPRFSALVYKPITSARREDSASESDGGWSAEEVGELTERVDCEPLTFDRFYAAWREMRLLVLEINERLHCFKGLHEAVISNPVAMAKFIQRCNKILYQQMVDTGSCAAVEVERADDLIALYDKAYVAYRDVLGTAMFLCMGAVQYPVIDISGRTPNIGQSLAFLHQPTCVSCPAAARGKPMGQVFDARRNEIVQCSQCHENFLMRFFYSQSVDVLNKRLEEICTNILIAMRALMPITPGFE